VILHFKSYNYFLAEQREDLLINLNALKIDLYLFLLDIVIVHYITLYLHIKQRKEYLAYRKHIFKKNF